MLIVLLLALTTNAALADQSRPMDTLRRGVEKGLGILNDPRYSDGSNKEEQHRKLEAIVERLFDFREFSRRVLASNWDGLSAAQKDEFVAVFTDFLSRFYVGRLQERYRDESVLYLGQTVESPVKAMVNVAVVWQGQQVPVDLRMIRREGRWKVYDIQVVGIGAVIFYRAQFNSLLRKETLAQVIGRIKDHTREIE